MVETWSEAWSTAELGATMVLAIVLFFVALRILAYIIAGWRRRRLERESWRAHVDRIQAE